jgi:hypothetical protein
MGGIGGGMGGMGGGGMFNVGPEKVGRIKVALVCLEHGKKDPDSRMEYEIRPIESFTRNSSVIEVCKMLARGEVSQNVAQAAAWNLANGLSWDQLAAKDRVRLMDGSGSKYFNLSEIRAAIGVADEAVRRGKETPVKNSDAGKENSLSQR